MASEAAPPLLASEEELRSRLGDVPGLKQFLDSRHSAAVLAERRNAEAMIHECESEMQSLRRRLDESAISLAAARRETQDRVQRDLDLGTALETSQASLATKEKMVSSLERELSAAQRQVRDLEHRLDGRMNELTNASEHLGSVSAQLVLVARERTQIQSQLVEAQHARVVAQSEGSVAKNSVEVLTREATHLREEIMRLSDELVSVRTAHRDRLRDAQEQSAQQLSEISTLRSQLSVAEEKLAQTTAALEREAQKLSRERELHTEGKLIWEAERVRIERLARLQESAAVDAETRYQESQVEVSRLKAALAEMDVLRDELSLLRQSQADQLSKPEAASATAAAVSPGVAAQVLQPPAGAATTGQNSELLDRLCASEVACASLRRENASLRHQLATLCDEIEQRAPLMEQQQSEYLRMQHAYDLLVARFAQQEAELVRQRNASSNTSNGGAAATGEPPMSVALQSELEALRMDRDRVAAAVRVLVDQRDEYRRLLEAYQAQLPQHMAAKAGFLSTQQQQQQQEQDQNQQAGQEQRRPHIKEQEQCQALLDKLRMSETNLRESMTKVESLEHRLSTTSQTLSTVLHESELVRADRQRMMELQILASDRADRLTDQLDSAKSECRRLELENSKLVLQHAYAMEAVEALKQQQAAAAQMPTVSVVTEKVFVRNDDEVIRLTAELERMQREWILAYEKLDAERTACKNAQISLSRLSDSETALHAKVQEQSALIQSLQQQLQSQIVQREVAATASAESSASSLRGPSSLSLQLPESTEVSLLQQALAEAQIRASTAAQLLKEKEQSLTDLGSTMEDLRREQSALTALKDAEIERLSSSLSSLEKEFMECQSQHAALKASHAELNVQRNNAVEEASHVMATFDELQGRVREAVARYESEVVAHGRDLETLSRLRIELCEQQQQQQQPQVSAGSAPVSGVSFETEMGELRRENEVLKRRVLEMMSSPFARAAVAITSASEPSATGAVSAGVADELEMARLRAQISRLEDIRLELESQVRLLQQQLQPMGAAGASTEVEELKEQVLLNREAQRSLRRETEVLRKENERMLREMDALKVEFALRQEQIRAQQTVPAGRMQELETRSQQLQALSQQLEGRVQELAKEVADKEAQIQSLTLELAASRQGREEEVQRVKDLMKKQFLEVMKKKTEQMSVQIREQVKEQVREQIEAEVRQGVEEECELRYSMQKSRADKLKAENDRLRSLLEGNSASVQEAPAADQQQQQRRNHPSEDEGASSSEAGTLMEGEREAKRARLRRERFASNAPAASAGVTSPTLSSAVLVERVVAASSFPSASQPLLQASQEGPTGDASSSFRRGPMITEVIDEATATAESEEVDASAAGEEEANADRMTEEEIDELGEEPADASGSGDDVFMS